MRIVKLLIASVFLLLLGYVPEVRSSEPLLDCTDLEKKIVKSSEPLAVLPTVEINFLEREYKKPPLTKLFFDVTLRNESAQSRWFILPENLSPWVKPLANLTTNELSVSKLNGEGSAIIGNLRGYTSFYTLHLPGGAVVTIRHLPFSYWEQDFQISESVLVEILIASQIQLGSELAESWFGIDSISDVQADVSFEQRRDLSSKHNPQLVPISLLEAHCLKVEVNTP